jgi:hypothetical protein
MAAVRRQNYFSPLTVFPTLILPILAASNLKRSLAKSLSKM